MEQESFIKLEQDEVKVIIDWYPYGKERVFTRHSVLKLVKFENTGELVVLPAQVTFSTYSGWHSQEQARQHIAEMEIVLGIARQLDALILTRDHFATRRIYVRQVGTWFDVSFEVETEQKED